MSVWSAVLIVAMVGLMTYGMRAVAIVALAKRAIPPWAERALRSVGPAVLAALTINLAAGVRVARAWNSPKLSLSWSEVAWLCGRRTC